MGAALAEEVEHRGAGVDGFGLDVAVLSEELREETAVTVTENEGGFLLEEVMEVVEASLLERWAEGEVFEPAIGAGDGVEVGWGGHRMKGRRRMGVRRARSAAARRVVGWMFWCRRWRTRRKVAARAVAVEMGHWTRWSKMATAVDVRVRTIASTGRGWGWGACSQA